MQAMLRAAYDREWEQARAAQADGAWDLAMRHLERAHVLGQRHTWPHARTHVSMLIVAWRRRRPRDAWGQVTRIVAALVFSRVWVPLGNTGGSDVSAFRRMPIPDDLAVLFESKPGR